jgi:dipeptidyl aminopeptidase/acylaminoacyl peptidase
MTVSSKCLRTLLLGFVALVALIACKPDTPPNQTSQAGALISPKSTPTAQVSILPTPTINSEDIEPTISPSLTPPPVPTRLSTPVVTPIPTTIPPIIPLSVQTTKPYMLVFHDNDVIQTVSISGNVSTDNVLLDVHAQSPLFLADERSNIYNWGSPSPDGSQLAIVLSSVETLSSLSKNEVPKFSIYLLDLSTGRLQSLVQNGVEPVWSPDSTRIAYRDKNSGLSVIDVTTGKTQEIYAVKPESGHFVTAIDWAPDSKRLVFSDAVFRESYAIVVADANAVGPATTLVSSTTHWPRYPKWSPTGDKILYVSPTGKSSGPDVVQNLWAMNPDGSGQVQLTHDVYVYDLPRWSPDGNWIVFAGPTAYENLQSFYELWLVDKKGSEIKRLTSNITEPVNESAPMWSPDGTQIIFAKDENTVWFISLIDGNQMRIPSATEDFLVLP